MALQTVTAGTVIRSTALFLDAITNEPGNPAEVTMTWIVGSADPVQNEFGASAIVNPETGEFFLDIDTTTWATILTGNVIAVLQWAGEGSVQIIDSMSVLIQPPAAVPTFL